MNDFDFEELDKAVNQLATKTQDEHADATEPASVAPAAQPVTVNSDAPKSAPAVAEAPAPSTEPEPTRSVPTPAARPSHHSPRLTETRPRGRGAFMDIVPPASSRKSGTRVGVSIQPLNKPEDIIPQEPAKDPSKEPADDEPSKVAVNLPIKKPEQETPEPAEQEAPQPPEMPQPRDDESKPSSDVAWPDPLDFHGDDMPGHGDKPAEPADTPSPFIAEAKVEKRPLGAFSNFRPQPEQEALASKPEPEPVKDELTPERDGTFEEPAQPKPEVEAEASKPPKAPTAAEAEHTEEPSRPDMHSAAMMSIPKQYHTEAKTTDKTTRPIFDTKEYHPPLLEAAVGEHRGGGSMWGKLFIALVVLVLLGVAGYFAYLYVTQR